MSQNKYEIIHFAIPKSSLIQPFKNESDGDDNRILTTFVNQHASNNYPNHNFNILSVSFAEFDSLNLMCFIYISDIKELPTP